MVEVECVETPAVLTSNPSVTLLPEEGEEREPELQRGTHSSPAKLWHLGRSLHRVPVRSCIMIACRVVPAERMGIHLIFCPFLTQCPQVEY